MLITLNDRFNNTIIGHFVRVEFDQFYTIDRVDSFKFNKKETNLTDTIIRVISK